MAVDMNKSSGQFDLIVIGAGSAGFSASITAAEQGAEVALIGHGTLGGTCVNVGCVPSKALIRASEALHQARTASRFGGLAASASVEDWRATVRNKNELVQSLRQAKYSDLLPDYANVTYIEGRARLAEGGAEVDGQMVFSPQVIIATGSSAFIPPIPGMEDVPYLTSTEALDLEELPKSMIVLGGGYMGCELAQMFARAGVRVTFVYRSRLLPQGEPEIGHALAGYLAEEGIAVRAGVTYRRVRKTDQGVSLTLGFDGREETVEAEHLLVTAGRTPNADGLGLEEMGVARTGNGGIEIDDRMRTSVEGIYAAGDVTGRDMYVYMAAYGARIAAENALNSNSRVYDATAMPGVVFTDPQAASVGLTEAEARGRGIAVRTSVLPLEAVPRALAARDARGLIKLVAEEDTGKLLGAHILAPEGGDSIQTAVLAIKHGMTVAALAETIFPYLTTVEGLKLAALAFDKDVSKLSCCAG